MNLQLYFCYFYFKGWCGGLRTLLRNDWPRIRSELRKTTSHRFFKVGCEVLKSFLYQEVYTAGDIIKTAMLIRNFSNRFSLPWLLQILLGKEITMTTTIIIINIVIIIIVVVVFIFLLYIVQQSISTKNSTNFCEFFYNFLVPELSKQTHSLVLYVVNLLTNNPSINIFYSLLICTFKQSMVRLDVTCNIRNWFFWLESVWYSAVNRSCVMGRAKCLILQTAGTRKFEVEPQNQIMTLRKKQSWWLTTLLRIEKSEQVKVQNKLNRDIFFCSRQNIKS